MTARFPLSPTLCATTRVVGQDREPVVTIDGLLRDPAALVDEAAAAAFASAHGPAGGYPGLRAPAPLDYVGDVVRALVPTIVAAFGLSDAARPRHAECSFSLVTLPPGDLVPAQRAPHVDTTDAHQFALLHYLCDARLGGTAFFRHRATGFEAITPERLASYDAARATEPAGEGYATGDDAAFATIGAVDAAFDRLVIYRSRLLHSGVIRDPAALSSDPRRGRLTANIFLTLA